MSEPLPQLAREEGVNSDQARRGHRLDIHQDIFVTDAPLLHLLLQIAEHGVEAESQQQYAESDDG